MPAWLISKEKHITHHLSSVFNGGRLVFWRETMVRGVGFQHVIVDISFDILTKMHFFDGILYDRCRWSPSTTRTTYGQKRTVKSRICPYSMHAAACLPAGLIVSRPK
jgi:hypothetical protein